MRPGITAINIADGAKILRRAFEFASLEFLHGPLRDRGSLGSNPWRRLRGYGALLGQPIRNQRSQHTGEQNHSADAIRVRVSSEKISFHSAGTKFSENDSAHPS